MPSENWIVERCNQNINCCQGEMKNAQGCNQNINCCQGEMKNAQGCNQNINCCQGEMKNAQGCNQNINCCQGEMKNAQGCNQNINCCQGEMKNAQGWIRNERAGHKRQLLWKEAAQSGLSDMNKIINMAKSNQTEKIEMKKTVVNMWGQKYKASKTVLGICGYDFGKSNRVQRSNRRTIGEILHQS